MSFTMGACMRTWILPLAAVLVATSVSQAAPAPLDRLSSDVLDIVPPTERVSGEPGKMTIEERSCRAFPADEVRRRIVDAAVQEWGYFGFSVVDQTIPDTSYSGASRGFSRPSRLGWLESARVADSIAGYWTVTPDGSWILERQNRAWNGPSGEGARWRDPWSAAFISWVMCEGGLGESSQFRRAIAHHVYIDQAIRARDDGAPQVAFAAYDVGETAVQPGDLLCSARREAYRTLEERRAHLGVGARTHCDIVVKVDEASDLILAIGGNVRGSVRLKLWPAERSRSRLLYPMDQSDIPGGRAVFAHLKLRTDPIEADALGNSPTIKALSERDNSLSGLQLATTAEVPEEALYRQLWPVVDRYEDAPIGGPFSMRRLAVSPAP